MTTETPRPIRKSVTQQIAEYRADLEELRAAMRARAELEPNSPEFQEALALEDELLERIHEWSIRRDPNESVTTPGGTR